MDYSVDWQCFFQDAASPVMEGIINLHHELMLFITFIFFFVLILMVRTLYFFWFDSNRFNDESRFVVHGTLIEII
jgi:cytochrome c oxidase subunit 2